MLSVRPEQFEGAVAALFEAAVIGDRLPDALQTFAHAAGSAGAVLHQVGTETVTTSSPELAEIAADFGRLDQNLNQRMTRGLAMTRRGAAGFLTEHACFTDDEFAADLLQQEFYRPRKLWSFAGVVIAAGGGVAMPLVLERAAREGSFSSEDIRLLNGLLPSLRDAGALARRRVAREHRSMLDVLNLRGEAAALVFHDGLVVRTNALFDALAPSGVAVRQNRLCLADADSQSRLREALFRIGGKPGAASPAVFPVQRDLRTGHPLLLEVLPLVGAARDIFDTAAGIVFVTDLGPGGALDLAAVRSAFRLTEMEARLALALAEGSSLEEIAKASQRSYETIRSQLKALFRKTGTSRQTELVAQIARFRRARISP